jgi:hypothetical protein
MEIYEIRPTGEGKRCFLSDPLGIVDNLEIDTIREAALHAQFCAGGREAILRTFNADGALRDERAIPPKRRDCIHGGPILPRTYFGLLAPRMRPRVALQNRIGGGRDSKCSSPSLNDSSAVFRSFKPVVKEILKDTTEFFGMFLSTSQVIFR